MLLVWLMAPGLAACPDFGGCKAKRSDCTGERTYAREGRMVRTLSEYDACGCKVRVTEEITSGGSETLKVRTSHWDSDRRTKTAVTLENGDLDRSATDHYNKEGDRFLTHVDRNGDELTDKIIEHHTEWVGETRRTLTTGRTADGGLLYTTTREVDLQLGPVFYEHCPGDGGSFCSTIFTTYLEDGTGWIKKHQSSSRVLDVIEGTLSPKGHLISEHTVRHVIVAPGNTVQTDLGTVTYTPNGWVETNDEDHLSTGNIAMFCPRD